MSQGKLGERSIEYSIIFTRAGLVLVDVTRGLDMSGALEENKSLIAAMAPRLDYACIVPSAWGTGSPAFVLAMARGPLPAEFGKALEEEHEALRTHLPDIFGLQMLGPGHPDLKPAGQWTTTDLGDGRRLVAATSPREWFAIDFMPPVELKSLREHNADTLLMDLPYHEGELWGRLTPPS